MKGKRHTRKHTPIRSVAQRRLFGAELSRRKAGKHPTMQGITEKELKGHLEESAGKELPMRKGNKKKSGEMIIGWR